MELQTHYQQAYGKNNLIDAAITSLNRLNLTVNEMKRWTSERASLQRDVWRLQTALQTIRHTAPSILLSRDPLVRHQNEEINRLAVTNNSMKTRLQSMNNVLLETERTIAWNVDKRVRSELTRINSQVAEERLQLAREIARLKQQLNDTDTTTTLQQIKRELFEFAEGDRKLDQYFSLVTNKVISTVNDLSNKLLKVNGALKQSERERTYLRSETAQLWRFLAKRNSSELQLEYCNNHNERNIQQIEIQTPKMKVDEFGAGPIYLERIKNEVANLQREKALLFRETTKRERALTRNISGIKTKLTIALITNEKLNEKIKSLERDIVTKLGTAETDSSMQTEGEVTRLQSLLQSTKEQLRTTNAKLVYLEEKWNGDSDKKQLESELIVLKEENNEMVTQLVMERTTAQEALREFERLTKDVERLEAELEDVKLERIMLKKDAAKIRMENSELRDAKMIYMKKSATLGKGDVKEREDLQNKIRLMKMRLNKLMGDLKKSDEKTLEYEETIRILNKEKIQLQNEIEVLNEKSQALTHDLEKIRNDNAVLETTVDDLESKTKQWTIEQKNLNHELNDFECQVEKYKTDIVNVNELLCESNKLNEKLKRECEQNVLEIEILTNELRDTENECEELKIRIETMSSTISSLKLNNADMKMIIDNSKAENNQLRADREIIAKEKVALENQFEELRREIKTQTIGKYSNLPKELFVGDVMKQNNEVLIENMDQEFTTKAFNQFVNHSEKTLLKSLEETDRELQTVKNDLSKVRNEVGYLRSDLDNGKLGLRSLTNENSALKEELAKLRTENRRLETTVREIEKGHK